MRILWIVWALATLLIAGSAIAKLYVAGDRTMMLPGETTGVHHALEISCETCHTSDAFEDIGAVRKDINKTCNTCHKDELKEANDSHPIKKFKPPRMASYWDKVDARQCTTCHSEHQPADTLPMMLTIQGDYCVACHSEGDQDVRKNRETHADLTFDTCASAGCHNFHDNRALYEDFLVKHADQPWLLDDPVRPETGFEPARPAEDEIAAYLASVNAPANQTGTDADHDWAASAHAVADVTCASCHAPKSETPEEIAANWVEAPEEKVCAKCHKGEMQTFAIGRHGSSRHPEIAKPRSSKAALKAIGIKKPSKELVAAIDAWLPDAEPAPQMSTIDGRVDLHPDAMGLDLTCSTCHDPHEQNVAYAAVEACLTCHDDDHSTSYKDSPHFALWQAEQNGTGLPGTGVTCATCHMPSEVKKDKILTTHNQNETLRPNEKMIRPVCQSCHGLGFAIDALADPALIENNFSGQPNRHIESIDWAVSRVEQPDQGANQ